jgi:hypothetical protein
VLNKKYVLNKIDFNTIKRLTKLKLTKIWNMNFVKMNFSIYEQNRIRNKGQNWNIEHNFIYEQVFIHEQIWTMEKIQDYNQIINKICKYEFYLQNHYNELNKKLN